MEQTTVRRPRLAMAAATLLAIAPAAGRAEVCGDVNGDGLVSMADVGICLAAFGSQAGDPDYNPHADLDGDGDVDQQDLAWIITFFSCHDSTYYPDAPPCGPCEPVGEGTMTIDLAEVDNTSVGPGDDSQHPEFNGGVTHFTFDLTVTVTADNYWTTQQSYVDLLHPEVEFFNHAYGGNTEPSQQLINYFPALEFDSFYANPPTLFDGTNPGFAWGPHWTNASVEAVWFDTPWPRDYTATTQRLTFVVPAESGIAPAVLPEDCAHDFVILAEISTDVTAATTGADLQHREFVIVDLAQPLCPGDIDGDSFVGQADLGILLSTYNRPPDDPQYDNNADLDCDGDVDQSDLGELLGNFGADC